ncbi:MAG: hypothetical protein KGS72_14365 [Cyanobacteria bacterium REEB67]|nr:hypothetical protein [Cyanobacteria bacterium REEB67]
MFIMQMFGWTLFSCMVVSFIEHQVHVRMMHQKNFLARFTDKYQKVYEAHAINHHGHYSAKMFSDEPVAPGEDKEIRLTVHKAPMKVLPLALLIALVSWQGGLILMAVAVFHHWAWNKIHLEMHKPEDRGFSHWPLYKFLARYHWLHHKYPNRNMNVVFPFADYVLGTHVTANADERNELRKLGYLDGAQEEVRTLVKGSKS